jgi:mannose-1-phosphate guanylyltransferase
MAGGIGSRFWPKSRRAMPKQFLPLIRQESMIQGVVNNISGLIPHERIYAVTTKGQVPLICNHLPWIETDQIIVEPIGRNTAPCICLAALTLSQIDPEATMIILPADHNISDIDTFNRAIKESIEQINERPEFLMTIGIKPTYPATGYGYIHRGVELTRNGIFRVNSFIEKPNRKLANTYFQDGHYYWNSGMFLWKVQTILKNFQSLMPVLYQRMMEVVTSQDNMTIDAIYQQIESQSIDYGIMEKARDVLMIEGDFGWSDVGSWDEVFQMRPKDSEGNVIIGSVILKDVKDSYVETVTGRLVAIVGVQDLIVVDTKDALLICRREQTQEVKWVVERLKTHQ